MSFSLTEIKLIVFQSGHLPLSADEFNFKDKTFNLNQLKEEWSTFYQLFTSNQYAWLTNSPNEVLCYLDFLCALLLRYYKLTKVQNKSDEFKRYQDELKSFKKSIHLNCGQKTVSFDYFLFHKIAKKVRDGFSCITSASQLREQISNLNAYRLYWYFCQDLSSWILLFLKNQINKAKIKEQIDNFLDFLNKPNGLLCVLSVGIYAIRFMIDLITLIKHVIRAQLGNELSSKFVLIQEIKELGLSLLNDVVWGIVNLLTNYNKLFHLSENAANTISVVFFAFDALFLISSRVVDTLQYRHRIQELEEQKSKLSYDSKLFKIIHRQLDIIHDHRTVENAYFIMNMVAAICLAVGIGCCLFLPGGFLIYLAIALKIIGSTLYASASEYKKYKQALTLVQRELANHAIEPNPELLQKLTTDCKSTHLNFYKKLMLNALAPTLILVTAAIYWPVALLLAAAYLTYQLVHAYKKERTNQEPKSLEVYRLFHQAPNKEESLPPQHGPCEWTEYPKSALG